jgi:hypothetical protein
MNGAYPCPDEVVNQIDSSLRYRNKLVPSSLLVYRVEREGSAHVLKTTCPALEWYEWGVDHLKQEKEILDRAEGVSGITHLVQTYRDGYCYRHPILKEFYKGKDISCLDVRINDTALQKRLEATVRNLHSLGIARLDLFRRNIVLSPDRKDACIIDLGNGVLSRVMSLSEFEKLKDEDMHHLEGCIFG